ncbi:MAG: hypothetical protein OHK0039_12570 [Bacteroidia bacterium]
MTHNQEVLDQRIRDFRRKYYVDRILRGSLVLGILISSILFVALLSEGLFGFSSGVRTFMVYSLAAVFVGVLGYMVVWPVAQLLRMARGLSDFQIADMVRRYFPEINDKLINLLQLKQEAALHGALAQAAVEQKAGEISPVPLSSAINLKLNRRYLLLLLIPIGLFFITHLTDPTLLGASSHRLINYKQSFLPPPPFRLIFSDIPETLIAGEQFTLHVQVEGEELPAELYLLLRDDTDPGNQYIDYSLERISPVEFSYTFNDIKSDFSFFIASPEIVSDTHRIDVRKRPFIKNFRVEIAYPAYTGLAPERLDENIGDFKVLKGSTVKWFLETQGDVATASFVIDGQSPMPFIPDESGSQLSLSCRLMEDFQYHIALQSPDSISNIDTVSYRVDIQQDRYPSIYIFSPNNDLIIDLDTRLPLEMEIGDDFGFTRMALFYRFTKSGGTSQVSQEFQTYELGIDKKILLQPRSADLDLTELGMQEGDELEYYLKVWDNDGVSGPKAATSATFKVIYPTLDARYEEMDQAREEVERTLDQLKRKSEELRQAYQKMQEKLLDQRELSFDDRREVERMVQAHQQMLQQLEQTQQRFEETKEKLQQNQMISEQTLEKYEDLNEFMKELENPEIEKLLQEIEEKMEALNPEDIRERLEKLQMNEEELKKSLERTLELLKQMEVQQKIDELRNKIDNLEAKQRLLEEKTPQTDSPEDMLDMAERQEDLMEQMEAIQEDIDELKDLKEKTNTPDAEQMENLDEMSEEADSSMEQASEKMKQAAEQMQQGGRKNNKQSQQSQQEAAQSQQDAADKLEQMSEELSNMQSDMQMQQDQQNLESLRELLENLLKLSFDQEDLKDEVKKLQFGDPALKEKSQEQKKLQDDMGLVRDSLEALANRVFQIQKFVLDESQKINTNMQESQEHFRNKQIPRILNNQQEAMTSINNLANMLSDVMKQIQQQMMSAQQSGNQMCQKPGGQKPNMQGISMQQRKLNEKMQQMMQGQMNPQQMGEMAGEQEAIRKQLEEAKQRMEQEGGSALGDLDKIMQDMKESETDLINKQLTHETMLRQQQILSRLLQSDKSMRERELDDQRESRTAQQANPKSPEQLSLEEYKNKIRQELLKTNKLEYSSDFIILIEQYFKQLEGANE